MTSAIEFPAYVIGLMSGTSADGVDAALMFTDGRDIAQPVASASQPYDDALRADILALMRGKGDADAIAHALTEIHRQAVEAVIANSDIPREKIALIGFHGQTIEHRPELGYTWQIGKPAWLAQQTGMAVVADFRSNDIRHGGQGAPLVPLYHAALARDLPKPVMVVNIGGVSNYTWIGASSPSPLAGEGRGEGASPRGNHASPPALPNLLPPGEEALWIQAADCGPGNALIDDWVGQHTGARYDNDGAAAKRGIVHEATVKQFLRNAFFVQDRARSLDRNHFTLESFFPAVVAPETARVFQWEAERRSVSMQDGAATLTAITAAAIGWSARAVPETPAQLLITGGGRHNTTLMKMIAERARMPVLPVEAVGWNGDMLEAEAFAYLAARSVQGLPLSLPETTGVSAPVSGGALFPPK